MALFGKGVQSFDSSCGVQDTFMAIFHARTRMRRYLNRNLLSYFALTPTTTASLSTTNITVSEKALFYAVVPKTPSGGWLRARHLVVISLFGEGPGQTDDINIPEDSRLLYVDKRLSDVPLVQGLSKQSRAEVPSVPSAHKASNRGTDAANFLSSSRHLLRVLESRIDIYAYPALEAHVLRSPSASNFKESSQLF
ncbi:hypothetical protein C8R44DRAFT_738436 [Mycena epipterygia]|nr:hypothetical protein C8R44DRAFT_738436 [Mycena epipterygia]